MTQIKLQPDGDNGQYLRAVLGHVETSVQGIYKRDMNVIMSNLLDVSVPVAYQNAGAIPMYKDDDMIHKFRTVVGWNDDGHNLAIAVRNGQEVELVHYSRLPSVLGKIIKLQKERGK